jgi:hypothetical protein
MVLMSSIINTSSIVVKSVPVSLSRVCYGATVVPMASYFSLSRSEEQTHWRDVLKPWKENYHSRFTSIKKGLSEFIALPLLTFGTFRLGIPATKNILVNSFKMSGKNPLATIVVPGIVASALISALLTGYQQMSEGETRGDSFGGAFLRNHMHTLLAFGLTLPFSMLCTRFYRTIASADPIFSIPVIAPILAGFQILLPKLGFQGPSQQQNSTQKTIFIFGRIASMAIESATLFIPVILGAIFLRDLRMARHFG